LVKGGAPLPHLSKFTFNLFAILSFTVPEFNKTHATTLPSAGRRPASMHIDKQASEAMRVRFVVQPAIGTTIASARTTIPVERMSIRAAAMCIRGVPMMIPRIRTSIRRAGMMIGTGRITVDRGPIFIPSVLTTNPLPLTVVQAPATVISRARKTWPR